MPTREFNFDGLIGPTHNYAGLSRGNLASQAHRNLASNPREAALQGLAKMKFMADLGVGQAVIPPLERPDLATLRRLGFSGSDARVLARAGKEAPALLAACYSASSMWTANAATVSPSTDTADGRVHFTPANLICQFHRSLEPTATARILRAIFPDESRFAHHDPLPSHPNFGDEGAANDMRLTASHGEPGIEVFVYGRTALDASSSEPARFPARQTREASDAIARLHGLKRTLFIAQNPAAIDAGAFHNDVVAVANANVLLYHQEAYSDCNTVAARVRRAAEEGGFEAILLEVKASEVPLADAVRSYLFNSQIIDAEQGMQMICPIECQAVESSRAFLERLIGSGGPIRAVHYVDLRQSMQNGGGPACLRLRVVLTEAERAAVAPGVFLTDALYKALMDWVRKHYRDRLHPDDLADPHLIEEVRGALDELTRIIGLGSIYPFQK